MKVSITSRRGKRKLNIENGVGSVVPGQETSTEPSKDKVVDDAQTVVEISEKVVKSRQKDKNTMGGLAGGATKKRWYDLIQVVRLHAWLHLDAPPTCTNSQ
ncbi:unnamed protein product [Calypogeia fissa]